MTTVSLNFDGVESAQPFEPMPEGTYVLVIESAVVKESAKPGLSASLKLVLNGGQEYPANKVWHNLYLGEKSLPFVLQFFEALMGEVPTSLNLTDDLLSGMIGMPVTAVLEVVPQKDKEGKVKEGKFTNQITSFEKQ
jgi:hypothetical protein